MIFNNKVRKMLLISTVCCLLLSGCQQNSASSYTESAGESEVSVPELEQADRAFWINIDSVSKAVIRDSEIYVSPDSDRITISGWAVSPDGDDSLSSIYLEAGGHVFLGSYGVCRNDVAQMLEHPEATYCGFSIEVPVSAFFTEDGSTVEKISIYGVSHDIQRLYMPIEYMVVSGEPAAADEASDITSNDVTVNTTELPDLEQSEEPASVCVDQCNGREVGYGGVITLDGQDSRLSISGWALNQSSDELLSALYLIAGDKVWTADYGQPRSDVADNYGHAECTDCGFVINLSLSVLLDDTGSLPETIEFVGVSADGSYLTQPFSYLISQ